MKLYNIADLEQLTGIKAHTIRIWEKRYNLIEPRRTTTNIRKYDDDQVRKLLNVSTLLGNGLKISKVAVLSEKEIGETIAALSYRSGDVINMSFVNDLTASMLTFNEPVFERTFSAAVNRLGLYEAMIHVIYPLLYRTGIMWLSSKAIPVQEHFATCIIQRKIHSATDGLSVNLKKRKKFLLFLPQHENHEISLLFANYLIRARGHDTIYLGTGVPTENVITVMKSTRPDVLLTFFITAHQTTDVNHVVRETIKATKDIPLLVCGKPEITATIKKHKSVQVLNAPTDLLNYL
jgi:MerR family transcriptional regulator, light-induced transcriptional regulator